MAVKPIPDGYHSLTPYISVKDAEGFLSFLEKAFGAEVKSLSRRDDGSVWHADLLIGDSHLMVAQASEQWPAHPVALYHYVTDVDSTYRRALEHGATSIMEPADQFYGDRNAGVKDASGNSWWISTHIEDVSHEEMARRAAAAQAAQSAASSA